MNPERIFHVLIAPIKSEKAMRIGDAHNQYMFKVRTDSTKAEIAQAVESLFHVEVSAVNVLNMQGKRRRTGKGIGKRSDWKKAYITVKKDFEIKYTVAAE